MTKEFNDKIEVKEKDDNITFIITAESIKPIIDTIKVYQQDFNINNFITSETSAKDDIFNLLIDIFAQELQYLIEGSKYTFANYVDKKGLDIDDDIVNLLD